MRPTPKVPHRNRSPSGWWIASFIERFEYDDENKALLSRRCLAWENTILIKASNRDIAYRKALAKARLSDGSEGWNSASGRKGVWRFEGLTDLLPVYEDLEDGSEILWREYAGVTVSKVRARVKKKGQLSVFDDHREDAPSNTALQSAERVGRYAPSRVRR